MRTTKTLLNVSAFICFVFGAIYLFTLVFIPIGIYCFVAAKRFAYRAEHMFETFAVNNQTLKNYTIFASIACFPLGLLSIIPYLMIVGNKVKISGFNVVSNDEQDIKKQEKIVEIVETSMNEKAEKFEEVKEKSVVETETEEEKLEKLKKLENFKDKGIITEEEFEMAKEQLNIKK